MATRHISLPDDLNDKLDQPHINASGLIQDLVRAYFAYGDTESAVEHATKKRQDDRERRLTEACEKLQTISESGAHLDPFNDAVLKQASHLEIPPEAMVEHVEHFIETGEVDF